MAESLIPIKSPPGIQRDGTRLAGDACADADWCRWQRALPRKIGGYRAINRYLQTVSRALHEFTQNDLTYIHSGSATAIERLYIDSSYNTSAITDRTPTSGLTADARNVWQFAADGKLTGGVNTNLLLAQVAPNLDDITNNDDGALFYGNLTGTAALVPITLPVGGSATGGIVALHPYTFFFGNDGYVGWSVAGDPTDLSGSGSGALNATSQKIVRGIQLRGGAGNAPSGLFWSADALVRVSFIGGSPVFQFDTISTQTSIMSPRSVIEYDGIFYWLGIDRFLSYNGVVREIPNTMNSNYFFDNINYAHLQKVFAIKVPRYGEIWWCYPHGDATEPDHALIFNVRENIWYDTVLPTGGRSSGIFPTVFPKPLMISPDAVVSPVDYRITEDGDTRITEDGELRVTEESEDSTYKLWVHEQGVDHIDGQSVLPIRSYFETSEISMPVQKGDTRGLVTLMLEPDFVQTGDLIVQVRGRRNARAPEVNSASQTIVDVATTAEEQVVYLKEQRRELRLYFESNTVGGDYQMGLPLLHVQPGDGTALG